MFDRLKRSARQKLQRAVAEVVEEELSRRDEHQHRLHAETMAALDRLGDRVTEQGDRVHHRFWELEQSARRDIWYSRDVNTAEESSAFVLEHMPNAAVFWHPHDTLRYALGLIKGPGLALEFGVATGTTLTIIAEAVSSDRTVVGFDVFTGLPEAWRTGFPVGEFSQAEIPTVAGAEVVAGLFEDELPGFLARNDEPIAFLHVDCDLYSSTQDGVGSRRRPARPRRGPGVRRVLQLPGLAAA